MEGERTCPGCGKALKEGTRFCTLCGERIATAAPKAEAVQGTFGAGAPPLVGEGEGVTASPLSPAGGMGVAGMPLGAAVAGRRSRAPLLLGAAGGLLLIAGVALLVLYLTLWREGGGGTDNPMALARKYMEALEKKDVDAYMACFEEGFFSLEEDPLLEGMGMDAREMLEMALTFMEVSFEGVELELQEERDEATVVTKAGKVSVSVMGMEEEEDLAQNPIEFRMARKGGRWYLTEDPMPALPALGGGDFELFKQDMDMDMDMDEHDLEGLEEYLPEGWDIEDLEELSPEDLEELIRELMENLEEPPRWEEPAGETVSRAR